jgi:hypothetical protein
VSFLTQTESLPALLPQSFSPSFRLSKFSNRQHNLLEIAATHWKQTTATPSNRQSKRVLACLAKRSRLTRRALSSCPACPPKPWRRRACPLHLPRVATHSNFYPTLDSSRNRCNPMKINGRAHFYSLQNRKCFWWHSHSWLCAFEASPVLGSIELHRETTFVDPKGPSERDALHKDREPAGPVAFGSE